MFDPNLRVPSSSSFNMGWQRALNKNTSIEARFIHTSSKDQWTVGNLNHLNYNEVNIVENGFLNEFKLAQQNLVGEHRRRQGGELRVHRGAGHEPAADLPRVAQRLDGVG